MPMLRAVLGPTWALLSNSSRATGGVDPQIVQQAYEAATPARVKAERALQELEAERAQHGRRAGQLRQTLAEAERWTQANGIAAEALAA
jgi:hypothetical protein